MCDTLSFHVGAANTQRVDASAADDRRLSSFSVATLREIAAEMFAISFPDICGFAARHAEIVYHETREFKMLFLYSDFLVHAFLYANRFCKSFC